MATPNRFPGAPPVQSRYAPNQPYFPGLAAAPNEHLIAAGMEMSKVQPLRRPTAHDYPPGYLTCPFFFSSLRDEDFESAFDPHFWDYDLRREAQMILPYLWVGPYTAAQDDSFIRRQGITMLLAVRNPHPAYRVLVNGDKAAEKHGIVSEHVEIGKMGDLTSRLVDIIRGINDHVCRCGHHASAAIPGRKKVLVFCETGNEKALAVTMGYLMAMLNMDLSTAINNVQARRLCVTIDLEQVEMLNAFESILIAQRDVVAAQRTMNPQHLLNPEYEPTARKRFAHEINHFEPNIRNPTMHAAMQVTNPGGLAYCGDLYAVEDSAENRQAVAPFSDMASP